MNTEEYVTLTQRNSIHFDSQNFILPKHSQHTAQWLLLHTNNILPWEPPPPRHFLFQMKYDPLMPYSFMYSNQNSSQFSKMAVFILNSFLFHTHLIHSIHSDNSFIHGKKMGNSSITFCKCIRPTGLQPKE